MTAEREAMTLPDVRDELRGIKTGKTGVCNKFYHKDEWLALLADAIDAYLSRDEEPVYQHRLRIGSPNRRWFDCSKEEYEAMERNEHDRANFERRILYAQPPESARDAKRIADAVPTSWLDPLLTGPSSVIPSPGYEITYKHIEVLLREVKKRVEAAMAQESGDAT